MELTKTLDITPEEFFDQIEKSVLGDIEKATGKELTRAKLNGFKYKKYAQGGKAAGTPMDVKISKYRYPEVYEVRFTYSNGSNTITYRATPSDDGGMVLDYTERFINPRSSSGVMAQLQLKWYERRSRRRAEQTIAGIVKLVHADRHHGKENAALNRLEDLKHGR